jgi:NhaP-type Na+/H+ or K+/H+ antiporter
VFELAFAIVVGCTTGWVFRKSLEYGKKWELVDKESAASFAVVVVRMVSGSKKYGVAAPSLIPDSERRSCDRRRVHDGVGVS